MSQRTVPAMIMQPMFPLGDLNVARLTVAVEAVVVVVVGGVVTVSLVDPPVAGVVVEKLKLELLAALEVLDVLVTVTVFDPPDPHPARASAATAATPTCRFTACSLPVRAPGRRRWLLTVCHRGR